MKLITHYFTVCCIYHKSRAVGESSSEDDSDSSSSSDDDSDNDSEPDNSTARRVGQGRKRQAHRHKHEHSDDSGDGGLKEKHTEAGPQGRVKRKKRPNAYEKTSENVTASARR